jgi:hypothetical protein
LIAGRSTGQLSAAVQGIRARRRVPRGRPPRADRQAPGSRRGRTRAGLPRRGPLRDRQRPIPGICTGGRADHPAAGFVHVDEGSESVSTNHRPRFAPHAPGDHPLFAAQPTMSLGRDAASARRFSLHKVCAMLNLLTPRPGPGTLGNQRNAGSAVTCERSCNYTRAAAVPMDQWTVSECFTLGRLPLPI